MLILISAFLGALPFLGCTVNTRMPALEFFYQSDYIRGEIVVPENRLEETFMVPLISNQEFDDVEFLSVIGEGTEGVACSIAKESEEIHEYAGYWMNYVELKCVKEDFGEDVVLRKVTLRFRKSLQTVTVTFPADIRFRHSPETIRMNSMGLVKRIQLFQPAPSVPFFFVVVRSDIRFLLHSVSLIAGEKPTSLRYGIAATEDFDDVNDTLTFNLDPCSDLGLAVAAQYNLFLDLGVSLEEGRYANLFFPILLQIEVPDGTTREVLVLNTNIATALYENLDAYVDHWLDEPEQEPGEAEA